MVGCSTVALSASTGSRMEVLHTEAVAVTDCHPRLPRWMARAGARSRRSPVQGSFRQVLAQDIGYCSGPKNACRSAASWAGASIAGKCLPRGKLGPVRADRGGDQLAHRLVGAEDCKALRYGRRRAPIRGVRLLVQGVRGGGARAGEPIQADRGEQ